MCNVIIWNNIMDMDKQTIAPKGIKSWHFMDDKSINHYVLKFNESEEDEKILWLEGYFKVMVSKFLNVKLAPIPMVYSLYHSGSVPFPAFRITDLEDRKLYLNHDTFKQNLPQTKKLLNDLKLIAGLKSEEEYFINTFSNSNELIEIWQQYKDML